MGIQCNTRYGDMTDSHLPCPWPASPWHCSGCARSPFGNAGPQPNILDEIAALTPERKAELGLGDFELPKD